jgi:hypothetical protein
MPLLGSRGAASSRGFGSLANLGYFLRNSLRFRASNSAYLSRTPASAGNRKTWTWSGWVKRGALGTRYNSFFTSSGSIFGFEYGADYNQFWINQSGVWSGHSEAVFRDVSAWYHIVLVYDTTQATDTNRVRLYVNGVQNTLVTDGGTLPTQNSDGPWNQAASHLIGLNTTSYYFDGYLAEVNFVDGQALTPSSFGKTDATTGQWVPKKYAGTYGTNGFYLPFTNTTSTSTLGNDFSGNGNTWTVNNISLTADRTYDAVTDVPTLSATASNYATFNPLMTGAGVTVSQGNLFTNHNNGTSGWVSTAVSQAMPATGKWYIEMTVVTYINGYSGYGFYRDGSTQLVGNGASTGANDPNWWTHYGHTTAFYNNSSFSGSASTWSSGTMMLAFDADAGGKAYFGRNGTWYNSSDPAAGTNAPFTISRSAGQNVYFIVEGYNNIQWAVNAGQQGFAYTPPSGFKALNTFNLP